MSKENSKMKKRTACGEEIAKAAKTCPHCGSKNKQPIYKKWWFWLIVVVVVASVANSGDKSGTTPAVNETAQENQVTQSEAQIEYVEYTVAELVNDLENNALKAETKYNEQYVKLTGKLSTIDSDGKYISLMPNNGSFTLTGVQCYLQNEEQKVKVSEMSIDDIVTVKGKITDIGEVLGYQLDVDSIE